MEVYVLDGLLRRTEVIDIFESLIWAERFAEIGDFELVVKSTPGTKQLLTPGTQLAINESYRVQTVETVEDVLDANGREALKLKGRSIEALFEDRVLYDTFPAHPGRTRRRKEAWSTADETAPGMARYWFQAICVDGHVHASDIIPFANRNVYLNLFPPDNIIESVEFLTQDVKPMSLYKAFKTILDPVNMGFRLYRNPNTNELYFNVYAGCDRTTSQVEYPPVVFANDLENLQNISALTTIEKAKNVCYVDSSSGGYTYNSVFYPGTSITVYQNDSGPDVTGFDRRVMHLDAGEAPAEIVTRGDAAIQAWMEELGKAALVEQRPFQAFEGEIDQFNQFRYGVHYNLGDLVEMRSRDGAVNKMRVTEQIFSSDATGDKSYPTLAIELYIAAGAWASWKYNREWAVMGATEYWANQPMQ